MYTYKKTYFVLLILTISFLTWGAVVAQQPQEAVDRPNLIFLMADDQRADAFGFEDNKYIITPHLDKLASDGVVFKNAYHVSPICQPSRATVMTGQYLGTHGAGFDQPTNYIITREEFQNSYPVLLRKQGYFTGFIGKFGFAVGGEKKNKNLGYQNKTEYMPAQYFDVWNGFPGQGSYSPSQGEFNGYENNTRARHLTEFMGDQAIDFLKKAQKSGSPFNLSISFKAPHAPFTPSRQSRERYNRLSSIPRMINDRAEYHQRLPEVVKKKSRNARRYFGRTEGYYGGHVDYEPTWHIERDSVYQSFIKNYYALISGIDEVVGRIRGGLIRLGLEENTVIIYTSDNGFFNGSKQLMGKALLYEESVKAPMIVYDPRTPKKEGIQEEIGLISHVDIAPTMLDLANIETPKSYPGRSFLPIVYNKTDSIHKAVFGENSFDNFYPVQSEVKHPEEYQSIRSRFVRTLEYKYIRYYENHPVVEELYNIKIDPFETTNLINEPAYSNIAKKLRAKLNDFEKKYNHYNN